MNTRVYYNKNHQPYINDADSECGLNNNSEVSDFQYEDKNDDTKKDAYNKTCYDNEMDDNMDINRFSEDIHNNYTMVTPDDNKVIDVDLRYDNEEEFIEDIQKQDLNVDEYPLENKSPGVNILIDMDIVNKNAVFIIEMPESWDTKVYNRFKADDDLRLPELKEVLMSDAHYLDPSDNIGLNCQNNSERLNVEIEMLLCKENLNESEICANLNSRPVDVKRSSNFCPQNLNLQNENNDVNSEFRNKVEIKEFIEPKIERQRFQFESSSYNENKVENPSKRYDFRYKLPEVRWPFIRGRKKSVNNEIDTNMYKDPLMSDSTDNDNTKMFDFLNQFPKFEMPSICVKEQSVESDADFDTDQTKSNGESKRFDFRYQLPKLDLPRFSISKKYSTADADVVPRVRSSEGSINNTENHTERFDFRYQLPKFELPTFTIPRKSSVTDIEINVQPNPPDIDVKVERFDFRYQIPKFEFPAFTFSRKSSNVDMEADVHLKSSAVEENIDSPAEGFDFRFKFPKFDFTLFGSKENFPNSDQDIDQGVNINSTEPEFDLETNTKRFDFRYQLPKFEFPAFTIPRESSVADIDINVQSQPSDSDAKVERFDFRYQLPKIDFQLFGSKDISPNLNENQNPDINDVHEVQEKNPSVDDIEDDVDRAERFDFRYQLPKIDFNLFGSKDNIQNLNETRDTGIDVASNLSFSKESLAIENNPKRFDFRYQLPNIEIPLFAANENCPNLVEDANVNTDDLKSDDAASRFDFRFQLPKMKLSSFSFSEKTHTPSTDFNYDIKADPHLSSLIDDFGIDYQDTAANPQRNPYVNLSRNTSNHFAQIYLDNISLKRSKSLNPMSTKPYSSLTTSPRRDFIKSMELDRPDERLPLFSIKEKLQLSLLSPDYANTNTFNTEEHSDIDLFPSPTRIVFLPNFSPLVSINVGGITSSSESDVGSIQNFQRREGYHTNGITEQPSSLLRSKNADDSKKQSHGHLDNHVDDTDLSANFTSSRFHR